MINAILMVRRRKPGVPLCRDWSSPYNIVFRPNDLTASGLRARRNLIFGFLGWFVCAGVFLAVGAATDILQ
jgi:hypothetical protein